MLNPVSLPPICSPVRLMIFPPKSSFLTSRACGESVTVVFTPFSVMVGNYGFGQVADGRDVFDRQSAARSGRRVDDRGEPIPDDVGAAVAGGHIMNARTMHQQCVSIPGGSRLLVAAALRACLGCFEFRAKLHERSVEVADLGGGKLSASTSDLLGGAIDLDSVTRQDAGDARGIDG